MADDRNGEDGWDWEQQNKELEAVIRVIVSTGIGAGSAFCIYASY